MTIRHLHVPTLFLILATVLMAVVAAPCPSRAQEAQTQEETPAEPVLGSANAEQSTAQPVFQVSSAENEAVEAAPPVSEANRIMRISWVVEQDRTKLEDLYSDLEDREELFDLLGGYVIVAVQEIEDMQEQLEALPADSPDRATLQAQIDELEADTVLLNTQAEVSFTAEKVVREQIEALEKKIEREERTLAVLRGGEDLAIETPAAPPSRSEAATSEPSRLPISPLIPMPKQQAPKAPSTNLRPSAGQIAAARESDQRNEAAELAERDLVEFVKRRESLATQIELEKILLETAEKSSVNLEKILQVVDRNQQREQAIGDSAAVIRERQRNGELVERLLEGARREIEERTQLLGSFDKRMEALINEGQTVALQAEEARKAADKAERRSHWLASPVHPTNVARWAQNRLPRMLLVLAVIAALLLVLRITVQRFARVFVRHSRGSRATRTNRADTLAFSFRGASTVIIVVGGTLLVLQEAGVNIKTVLGGAAILGVAIAFGAQNLMRDYFTGFMILLEDQFELGDLVTIGAITGSVERVNMRVTMLRDLEGRVHFIPNGEIKAVTNRTYEWGRALVEIPVAYDADIELAMEVLTKAARSMMEEGDEFEEFVTDEPAMLGVDRFTESGILLKMTLQTRPDKIFPVRRELLRRIKHEFDAAGIRISVPHRQLVQPRGET